MSFRSKATFSFSGFLVFVTVLYIATSLYSHANYQEKVKFSSEEKTKHIPKIIEDLKAIEAAKIFLPITFEKNAETLVSKHVAWSSIDTDHSAASIALFKKHPDHLKTTEGYQKLIQDPEFQKFDTEWIVSLENYDHLDLTTHENVKSQLDRIAGLGGIERVGIHTTLPLLDFMDLVNQATILL